ncbi:hydrolase [Deinococcus irradiatisoli]|uniref:Hydrolase n=2 Tax=Deinococcus irradiatisoli TaxID=2202254 RepID=A0A2Z3JHW9_9DEIO|nr:ImmA/IrrE family metallo-endopeptidase [Deinococcus irradiatisoli]AWN24612.1 hydrolase [Deinococcus irradiatisoli]
MRALARDYAAALPALDTHSLMEGELLRAQDVRLEFMPMGERDGAYDPENKVILINSLSRPERQRFTLAHEISHALLLSDDDLLSDLHDTYEGERLESMIETLCNVGASGILISDALMEEVLQRHGPSARALAELVRRADVSGSAALYALSEAASGQVIFAVCAPSGRGEARQLTVRVGGSTAGVKYPLRPGTPIPDEHPVQIAFETGLEINVKSYVPFRSGRKMPAWVGVYPDGSGRRVFASFNLDPASYSGA